jgi:PTS system cellobiose-specific IIC component
MFFAGGTFLQRLVAAELPAFAIMGAALAVILPYRLARHLRLSAVALVAATLAAFALSLPRPFDFAAPLVYLKAAGGVGLFLAMLLALAVAGASYAMRRFGRAAESAGAAAVVAVLACAVFLFHYAPANGLMLLLHPLARLGDSYGALMVVVGLQTLLWAIGIHGPATLAAVITPLYLTLQAQNSEAFVRHAPLPHIVVSSFFLFTSPGGAGATLPVAFLLLFSRTARLRVLGRAAIAPSLININEPLLFGLPIVANPFLAVPFICVPLITATIAYFATAENLVARAYTYIPGALPSPVSAYLATLDWRAVVLVLLNVALATVLYFPFVRAYDRHEAASQ